MSQERHLSENQESKVSVVSAAERDPSGLVKNLLSLGTENIQAIDAALKKMEYGALEDMVSENYFANADEMQLGVLAHRISDMKYAVDKEERKRIAEQIAESIEIIGLE